MLCGRRVLQDTKELFVAEVADHPAEWHVLWYAHLCVFVHKVLGVARGGVICVCEPSGLLATIPPGKWQKRFRVEASEP